MKRDHLKKYTEEKVQNRSTLWKKIGLASKLSDNQKVHLQAPRLQTSLELQMLHHQNLSHKMNQNQENLFQNNHFQNKIKNNPTNNRQFFSIPFSPQRIKISQSICNIQNLNQGNHNMRDKFCRDCQQKIHHFLIKLNEQISIFSVDFKIIKQQINIEIRSYWDQILKIIQNHKFQISLSSLQKIDHTSVQNYLKGKKQIQDKLLWIQSQTSRRRNLIKNLQDKNMRIMSQIKILQRARDNFKPSFKNNNSFQTKAFFKNQNTIIDKKKELSFEFSDDSPQRFQRSVKTEITENDQSYEIEKIKKKIQGLKLRLNKTTSNYSHN